MLESNHQTSRFFTHFPTPGVEGVDALRSPWPSGLMYIFPPLVIISKVIRKLLLEKAELIVVAPHWPRHPWFADLLALSVVPQWRLPQDPWTLSQGDLLHPDIDLLQLTALQLSGNF